MTTEFMLMYILLIHFFADFGLQTHQQASEKSTDIDQLLYHCLVYTMSFGLATICTPFKYFAAWILFLIVTFITHFITDYCTSRIGKSYWDDKDFHNGFVIVGMDQIIHYITLYLSFKYILQIL